MSRWELASPACPHHPAPWPPQQWREVLLLSRVRIPSRPQQNRTCDQPGGQGVQDVLVPGQDAEAQVPQQLLPLRQPQGRLQPLVLPAGRDGLWLLLFRGQTRAQLGRVTDA